MARASSRNLSPIDLTVGRDRQDACRIHEFLIWRREGRPRYRASAVRDARRRDTNAFERAELAGHDRSQRQRVPAVMLPQANLLAALSEIL